MPPQAAPLIQVKSIETYVCPVQTRMPFRYGSARLVRCPHLYFIATIEDAAGRVSEGIAADNLPPRWFDKDPAKSYTQELTDQLNVIHFAADTALSQPPATAFGLWLAVYRAVQEHGSAAGFPSLLSGFGASLVERAVNDALGRLLGLPLHALLTTNVLGIEMEAMNASLAGLKPAALVPAAPVSRIRSRHTVGLSDPIRVDDIPPGERLNDGLPQSLDEVIRFYGARTFKIKTQNREAEDIERLTSIAALLDSLCPDQEYRCTLDGNEQYESFEELEPLVSVIDSTPALARLKESILFIEQPLARAWALDAGRCRALPSITARFPVIIDESDGSLPAFRIALDLGYSGTSHKNCKGLFKSMANLGRARLSQSAGHRVIISAEDLTNMGSVALEEDLCALGSLGITHAERNGHHYFYGLSHLSEADQFAAWAAHPDLYTRSDGGARVNIVDGMMDFGSVQALPGLGVGPLPQVRTLTPARSFDPSSVGQDD